MLRVFEVGFDKFVDQIGGMLLEKRLTGDNPGKFCEMVNAVDLKCVCCLIT